MDDYYDNGLEGAELNSTGHPTTNHGLHQDDCLKPEEQCGPSQHEVAGINCAQGNIDASNEEKQMLTCKNTSEVLTPSMSCLPLNIDSNNCVGDNQHENQVGKMRLLRENTLTEDKNMVNVAEEKEKLCSKDSGGNGKSSIPGQFTSGGKQYTDEGKAEAESIIITVDDYYDNGLEGAELNSTGHPATNHELHELHQDVCLKTEEQCGPSQQTVAKISCAQGYINAPNAENQMLTCKNTCEDLKPSMPCLPLNIDNNICVGDAQLESQVDDTRLLRENTLTEDKRMVNVAEEEEKLCSKDNGGSGTKGTARQLNPGRKQGTNEAKAQAESMCEYRILQEHVDYSKIKTLKTHFSKMASGRRLRAEDNKMKLQLNQDNSRACENTDCRGRNNPGTGTNPEPCKKETCRGKNYPKHDSVPNETKVGKVQVAGSNATTAQSKKIATVTTSHEQLTSNCIFARCLWKLLVLSTIFSVTVCHGDVSPLIETKIALAGSNVRLNCSSNSENPVDWDHKPSDTGITQHLYYGNLGLMSHDVSKRYSVDTNAFLRRYDLIITEVRAEDAGRYRCTEIFNEERQHILELVIVKEAPVCNIESLKNGVMGEVVFNLRQSPVVLNCSVAVSDNKDLTVSIVSTNSTSYPNSTVLIRGDSTVTVLMAIFPLPAISLNNEVFTCKVSVLESSADESASDDSIGCFYNPIIIHYAMIDPILSQCRSKTCNDVEKHTRCNPSCSYHFNEMEPDLCSCTVYYLNETQSFSWNCDDSEDATVWKIAVAAIGLLALVPISLAVYLLLDRRQCKYSVCGKYESASQDANA